MQTDLWLGKLHEWKPMILITSANYSCTTRGYPTLFTHMQYSKLAAKSCYMMKASLLTTLISLLWRTSLVTYFNNLFRNTAWSYWDEGEKKMLAQLGLGWEVEGPSQVKCFRLTFGFSNIFWKENCWQGCKYFEGLDWEWKFCLLLRCLLALKVSSQYHQN